MIKESDDKIGWREVFAISIYAMGLELTNSTPVLLVKEVENAIWIIPIVSFLVILLPLSILMYLLKTYKNKNLVELIYDLMGNFLGKLINFTLFAVIFSAFIIDTRDYIDIVSTLFFPNTPLIVLYIFFIWVIYFIATRGLETIGRTCWMTFIPLSVTLSMLIILVWPEVNFSYLYPLGGPGFSKIIKSGITSSSLFSDAFAIAIFFPHVRDYKSYKSGAYLGLIATVAYISFFFIIFTAAFGSNLLSLVSYPYHQLTRIATLGRFSANLEAFFFFFWIVASALRYAIYSYMAAALLGATFHISNYEKLLLPLSIVAIFLSPMIENFIQSALVLRSILLGTLGLIFIIIPFPLMLLYKLKRGKNNET
ncbi:endospore germination permease [Clostridium bovifaecis]|uniref:Endospore germination permease n=1 Tax=Clostridium bovifaecis TaxID=2184719 RepID=A0A6I6EUW3_9CLOT|nr:endospore germination permease [Clostridium bovifaecis]